MAIIKRPQDDTFSVQFSSGYDNSFYKGYSNSLSRRGGGVVIINKYFYCLACDFDKLRPLHSGLN